MAKELSKEATKILENLGCNSKDAYWQHKQSGQWIMRHVYCEIIAEKQGIIFDMPQVIEADSANKTVSICVRGYTPDGREAWSFGEAAPNNCRNDYPFSMAEKRAKDRVILKLVGLHGFLYSDQEADEWSQGKIVVDEEEVSWANEQFFEEIKENLMNCYNLDAVNEIIKDAKTIKHIDKLPEKMRLELRNIVTGKKNEYKI